MKTSLAAAAIAAITIAILLGSCAAVAKIIIECAK